MSTTTAQPTAALRRSEQAMLDVLKKHKGTPLSRERLAQLTGRPDHEVYDRSIDVCISRVRKYLEATQSGLQIVCMRNIGYVLREGQQQ